MSFAGLSLPADKSITDRPMDRPTDGRTHPLIESWLTTKKCIKSSLRIGFRIVFSQRHLSESPIPKTAGPTALAKSFS